jgi:lipoprotein LprG
MRTVRLLVVLLSLAATTVVAGCDGSDEAAASPRETLAAAKRNLDRTSGVRIGLSTPRLPDGVSGLLSARGVGTHAPAFAGNIEVAASGITADASVVAVDGKVHAKLPFSLHFVTIDPADYGAPDPARLMSSRGGLSSLLTSAEHVEQGKQVRQGKVVERSYTGTVPGRAVAAVLPSASAKAAFDATFTVSDRQRLTKAVLTGPFYPQAGDITYTLTFDDYGIHKKITAP